MGNKLGCNEAGVRCAANCARIGSRNTDCINEFMEDTSLTCDPAGTIFAETMEELGSHEKHLLFFCGSQNLAAVKWLKTMGACLMIQDSNGTSCLHHACRTGSASIVQYLLENGSDINLQDVGGWTPLHIACFMGASRVNVVKMLLSFKASPNVLNQRGQSPLDLCNDPSTRELLQKHLCKGLEGEEVLIRPTPESTVSSTTHHFENASHNSLVHGQDVKNVRVMSPSSSPFRGGTRRSVSPSPGGNSDVHIEPFFVPQQAELEYLPAQHKQILSKLGLDFFNANPGQGLSFLVSSGCVSDSPQPLLSHITSGIEGLKGDRTIFGHFLGESYSLSQILRLELMNALDLEHTGIVEALHMVGRQMHWPADFEKLDRLSFCCALMWWRKHDNVDGPSASTRPVRPCDGYSLKKCLRKKQELHQLMFAVLILHMNLHKLMGAKCPPMQLDKWMNFCRGITKLPEAFLVQLYHDVRHYNVSLVIQKPPKPDAPNKQKILRQCIEASGWVKVDGGMLPHVPKSTWQRPPDFDIWVERGSADMNSGRPSGSAMHYAAALSPFPVAASNTPRPERQNPNQCLRGMSSLSMSRKGKEVWMICAASCLFFFHSDQPGQSPWAYVYLPGNLCHVSAQENPSLHRTSVLASKIQVYPKSSTARTSTESDPSLKAVILHDDAKWTTIDVPCLDLTLRDSSQFPLWRDVLDRNSLSPRFDETGTTAIAA
eukprot:gene625-114_t